MDAAAPLDWGERIGPSSRQIVEHQLTDKPRPEMGYRACLGLGPLSLARRYGKERTAPCLAHPEKEAAQGGLRGGGQESGTAFFIMSDAVLPN